MLILSILLVVLYVGATIWRKRELPESVSAMVFDLRKAWRWLWQAWLAAVMFLFAPMLFEIIPEEWGAVAHAFCTSLLFIAVLPLVRSEPNRPHYVLSVVAGVTSQMCVLLICPWWLFVWAVMVSLCGWCLASQHGYCKMVHCLSGKGIFVIEVLCWLSLMGALVIH